MKASAWPIGRQVREPAGHGINFPQATESGNLKSMGMRLSSSPKATSQGCSAIEPVFGAQLLGVAFGQYFGDGYSIIGRLLRNADPHRALP